MDSYWCIVQQLDTIVELDPLPYKLNYFLNPDKSTVVPYFPTFFFFFATAQYTTEH